MTLHFDDRMSLFVKRAHAVADDIVREAARDTIISAKEDAPFDKGGLRRLSYVKHLALARYRVIFYSEYALFQEKGGDSERRVRNYTTKGTGKNFLKRAGDTHSKRMSRIARKHSVRL